MAASRLCVGGVEVLAGSLAGPGCTSGPALQSRSRRSSWHGDVSSSAREERASSLPPNAGGHQLSQRAGGLPGVPTPERGRGRRSRRKSTGEVQAETRPNTVLAAQVDAQRPMTDHLELAVGRETEESAHGVLDGGLEPLPVRSGLAMRVGVHVCPHPDKVEKGGEDAYFVGSHEGYFIGVADGVSGVAEDGIDPALYSRELMALAQGAADSLPGAAEDPRLILEAAHSQVQAQGACTAVVAALESRTGKLRIANLGDSGLRVLRGGRICFATPVLQHFFDCPFQYGSESSDSTADAEAFEVQLAAGDCLVMGSDGLFDNMYDRDIEAVCSLFNDAPEAAATTAVALANLAKKHSMDAEYESPYILEAIKEGYDVPFWKKMLGQKLTGGKKDDITVVVANIVVADPQGVHQEEVPGLSGTEADRGADTTPAKSSQEGESASEAAPTSLAAEGPPAEQLAGEGGQPGVAA